MKRPAIFFALFILLGNPAFGELLPEKPSNDVCERTAGVDRARWVGGKMWVCKGNFGTGLPDITIVGEGPRTDPVALYVFSPMGKVKGKPSRLGLRYLGEYLLRISEEKIAQKWPGKSGEVCIRNGNREVRININYEGAILTFARGELPSDVFDKCLTVEN